jgi:hypothetical protein
MFLSEKNKNLFTKIIVRHHTILESSYTTFGGGRMIINAFSGAGKTYLVDKYKDIQDLDSMDYHWIYEDYVLHLPKEQRKRNLSRKPNPAWPNNYIHDILSFHEKGFITLIGGSDSIIDYLESNKIPHLICLPTLDQKQDYLARFKQRGNSKEYINFWNDNFESFVTKKMQHKHVMRMLPGEYLEHTLKRIQILPYT